MKNKEIKPKPKFKVGDIISNDNECQKSKILEVHYDKCLKCYKYLVICLEDEGSLHFEEEQDLSELIKIKMTLKEIQQYYYDNEGGELEIIK